MNTIDYTATVQAAAVGSAAVRREPINRSFHLHNMTSKPMKLTGLQVHGDFPGGAPRLGCVLQPGQGADWEMQWIKGSEFNDAWVGYDIGDDGFVDFIMKIDPDLGGPSWVNAGFRGPFQVLFVGAHVYVFDEPGTVVDLPAAQGQAQADVLRRFCTQKNMANCTFDVTGQEQVVGTWRRIFTTAFNGTDGPVVCTAMVTDTMQAMNSIGLEVAAGGTLFDIIGRGIKARYQRDWTPEHTVARAVQIPVEPHTSVMVSAIDSLYRYTGDFTVTIGNTTWRLHGVCFYSYDVTRADQWICEPVSPEGAVIPGRSVTIHGQ